MRRVQTPNWLTELDGILRQNGINALAVGGLVRNSLMGLAPSDIDICADVPPERVMAALKHDSRIKVIPKAIEFGTIEIHFTSKDGRHICEYTVFRKEAYREGGSHRPETVVFSSDVGEDAIRRDFTVNAMYCPLGGGEVIDPTGGMADLEAKKIRATSKDPSVILSDDGLRIIRMVRFACELGFDIDAATFEAAKQRITYLADIAKERIRAELDKILLSDIRYGIKHKDEPAPLRGLKMLKELDAFKYILPRLLEGEGVVQSSAYHVYDVFEHNIRACAAAAPVLEVRLAALLHDVAKPQAVKGSGKMYNHEVMGAQAAVLMLGQAGLKYPNDVVDRVTTLIRWHMYDLDGKTSKNKLRLKFALLGEEAATQLIELREADVKGSGKKAQSDTAQKWRRILQEMIDDGGMISEADLQIDGHAIMRLAGIGPGKDVKRIKRALYQKVVLEPDKNKRHVLEAMAARLAKSMGII
ncbi:MAG: CCA tRNA nucleotidyltransferase [Christensenellales bacterium]|jgi:tRNA nucleotidyltransferase (CCA-adding enzyme)